MSQGGGGQGRKRKRQLDREKLQQYGIDLPEIRGLPVQVIPLHVFAMRKTGVFFRKDAKDSVIKPFLVVDDASDENEQDQATSASAITGAATGGEGVMDSIMQRVSQAAAAVSENTTEVREKKERRRECREAVTSWLDALRREMRDRRNSSNGAIVVIAAMEHLWSFLMDDDEKLSVRRTCLHLVGHLLEKSSDLRRWFLEESNRIGNWTDAFIKTRNERDAAFQLFQREGFLLLQHLDDAGYSDLYPRLRVAMQSFQQRFPWIDQDVSANANTGMSLSQLRQLRDVALDHWEKEEQIVRRLLTSCDKFMKILMPRIGDEEESEEEIEAAEDSMMGNAPNAEENEDDEQKEEEDIDWEDGIIEEDDDVPAEIQQTESHADAVERTLAVMQSSVLMRTGQLEINFDAATTEPNSVTPQMINAKEKLGSCVKKLRDRHVERLNTWVDALTRADTLVVGEGGSLVQIPSDMQQFRRDALRRALRLKAEVLSTLSSANRMDVATGATTTATTATQPTGAVPRRTAPLNSKPRPQNERLAAAINRRTTQTIDHTRKRSSKVRIKYR